MGPDAGDDQRRGDGNVKPTEGTSRALPLEGFLGVEASPLNCAMTDSGEQVTDQPNDRTLLKPGTGELFPIRSNIAVRLVLDQGTPTAILLDGGVQLERYPLRNRGDSDPAPKSKFITDMATVLVKHDSTSVDIDVKPSGFGAFLGRWIPGVGNQDEWLAIDREPRDPREITIVRPGLDRESVFLSA